MRELWRKIAYTSFARIYSLIVGMVTLMITARWLGPEGRGIVAAVTNWVALFSTVGSLSLGQVAVHRATTLRGQAWLGPTLGSLLLLDALITLSGWFVAAMLFLWTKGSLYNGLSAGLLALGFIGLPLFIWEQYGSALLMAVDRVSVYNRAEIVGRTVGLVLILAAWWLKWDLAGVLVATLVSQSIVALAGLRFLFGHSRGIVGPEKAATLDLLKGGFKLHLNFVGGFFIASSGVLIVNYYLGPAQTGYYQIAQQLVTVMAVVPQAASMVTYGQVAQLGPDAAWRQQRRIIVHLTLGMALMGVVAAGAAPWLVPLVLGGQFLPSVSMFQCLILALFGISLTTMMSGQWIGRGKFGVMSLLTIALGVINLVGNLLSVPRFGVYGAIWTAVITYALAAVAQIWMILKCEAQMKSAGNLENEITRSAKPAL